MKSFRAYLFVGFNALLGGASDGEQKQQEVICGYYQRENEAKNENQRVLCQNTTRGEEVGSDSQDGKD